ncbi:hypothetical protein JKP88DRAFT_349598 [Tribonema minus]|uniref:RIIa domain-containing protein n=1 Tax=Tribonema minus TaxID=303371 RepID=A0A835YUC4_9STRA|nr:hypothetical protein JKP88DRAFT_349598 [Tribonema minus]
MADGQPVAVDAGSEDNASGAGAEEPGCSTDDTKTDLEAENEAYLRDKPEVMALIRLFMTTVLEQRPADPRAFAAEFFGRDTVLERARERGGGGGAAAAAARPRERSSSHAERDASAAAAEAPPHEGAGARGSRAQSAPGAAAAASANESTSGDGLPRLREEERDGARQCRRPPDPSSPT